MVLSVALGVGIGIGYGLLAYGMQRLADPNSKQYLGLMMGGMLVRMILLLLVVAMVLLLVPVERAPFALSLVPSLLLGLGIEVWFSYRRLIQGSSTPRPSA